LNNYEGMFLVDAKVQKKDDKETEEVIRSLIAKCGGEVIELIDWDERKLAYEVKGATNGAYYLSYFSGESDTVKNLNHEIELSQVILRALFLSIKEIPDLSEPPIPVDPEEDESPEGAVSKDGAEKTDDATGGDKVEPPASNEELDATAPVEPVTPVEPESDESASIESEPQVDEAPKDDEDDK